MENQREQNIVLYVTSRASKAMLFKQFLPEDCGFSIKHVGLDLFEEQTDDQEKIAVSKAKEAWKILQKPLLVDDGAIFFENYHNFPGTVTKFVYKGLGYEGICRLLDEGDPLSVVVTTVLIWGPDQYEIFKVSKTGTFRKKHDPDIQFLFDETFVPDGENRTYSELREHPESYREHYFPALAARQVAAFISQHKIL